MLNEEEYSSDTSDEDFVPEGKHVDDDPESEEEEVDEVNESEDDESHQGKKRKLSRKQKQNKKKFKPKNPRLDKLEPQEETVDEAKSVINEAEESKKADCLWADFLADVDEKPPEQTKPKAKNSWSALLDPKKKKSPSDSSKGSMSEASSRAVNAKSSTTKCTPDSSTVKITKVFEFAGEEVRVEEEVARDSIEAKLSTHGQNGNAGTGSSDLVVKRPAGLSGVLSLLDDKKKKLSTLEKTKLDWVNFKSSEGLNEELHKHLKSKEGYLEKQAFLERADLRQFEIEKKVRMNRSNR